MDENEVKEEVQTEAVKETVVNVPLTEKKQSYGGLFALALLSIVLPGVVGIILGIIALVKSVKLRKSVEDNLVTASFVMSIVGIVLSFVVFIAWIAGIAFIVAVVEDVMNDYAFSYSTVPSSCFWCF